jgi:hypothetical protein
MFPAGLKKSQCFNFLLLVLFYCWLISAGGAGLAAELSAAQWRKDLAYLAQMLPKLHINLYHTISREQFELEVAELSNSMPNMTEAEVRTGFQRIVASVGDVHVWTSAMRGNETVPIWHRKFGGDIYAISATPEYTAVIGARLIGIGSKSIDEVIATLSPLARMETLQILYVDLPPLLHAMDPLRATGIWGIGDRAVFKYQRDGQTFSVEVKPVSGRVLLSSNIKNLPMYETNKAAYWFRVLNDTRALYIQYNDCKNMDALPFARFTKQVIDATRKKPIEKVIIDLRHNQGGDSEVIKPLFKALSHEPLHHARLYVITSPWTLSSATLVGYEMKTRFKALVVGETSGQKLHSYGNVRTFTLPRSGIKVSYCTKYINLGSDKEDLLIPDIFVPITADDYFAGRDSALERILAD